MDAEKRKREIEKERDLIWLAAKGAARAGWSLLAVCVYLIAIWVEGAKLKPFSPNKTRRLTHDNQLARARLKWLQKQECWPLASLRGGYFFPSARMFVLHLQQSKRKRHASTAFLWLFLSMFVVNGTNQRKINHFHLLNGASLVASHLCYDRLRTKLEEQKFMLWFPCVEIN